MNLLEKHVLAKHNNILILSLKDVEKSCLQYQQEILSATAACLKKQTGEKTVDTLELLGKMTIPIMFVYHRYNNFLT